jgi:hypothetical protein
MSRRRRRAEGESGARRQSGGRGDGGTHGESGARGASARRGAPDAAGAQDRPPGRAPYRVRPLFQVVILVAIFAAVTLIAELAGAANLGVSLGIAQIVFGVALVVVMLRS